MAFYLTPYPRLDRTVVGVRPGTWLVRLHGLDVRDGRFDGWIERDDPPRIGASRDSGKPGASRRSSRERSNVDHVVGELARLRPAASSRSANLDEEARAHQRHQQPGARRATGAPSPTSPRRAPTSSPRRAFSRAAEHWIAMSGTSMASPYVTGVVGLMLASSRASPAAQITGILQRTSRPLPAARLRLVDRRRLRSHRCRGACIEEAATVNSHTDRTA